MDWSPIWVSMKTAFAAICITFFLGVFAAWAVVRMKNGRSRAIWDGILTMPLVLPPTVSISPNCCVIDEQKPHFLTVSDVLKKSVDNTLALLRRELRRP